MTNCVFCKIISGTIPSPIIYENKDILVFLDIAQVTAGHTLVVPKKHVRNLLDMDKKTARKILPDIPQISKKIVKATKASGLNIVSNNGEMAGQTVFHAHIHLLPRYGKDDDFHAEFTNHKPNLEQLNKLAKKISKGWEKTN